MSRNSLPPGKIVRLICTGRGRHEQTPLWSVIDRRRPEYPTMTAGGDTAITVPAEPQKSGPRRWRELGEMGVVSENHGQRITYELWCPMCPRTPLGHAKVNYRFTAVRLPDLLDACYAKRQTGGRPLRPLGFYTTDVSEWS